MPLRINEILVSNELEEIDLMSDCVKIISSDLPKEYVSSYYRDEEGNSYCIVYNLFEKGTSDVVLKLNVLLKEREDSIEIVDMDVTIPNDNQLVYALAKYDKGENSNVDKVNELVVKNKPADKYRVSLSLMPFGEIKIASSLIEMNEIVHFMHDNECVHKIDGDYVEKDTMVAEVIDYNIVHVEIGDHVYEGVIAELNTAYGKVPALLPISCVRKLCRGYFLYFRATIKADYIFE